MNNHNYNESTNEICSADIFKRELSYINRMKGDYKCLKQLLLCCFLHSQSSAYLCYWSDTDRST